MSKQTGARLSAVRAEAIMQCLDALAEGDDVGAHWFMQPDPAGGWAVYLERDGARYRVVLEDESTDDQGAGPREGP